MVRATLNSTWIDVTVGLGHAPTDSRGLLGNSRGNAQVLETFNGVVLKAPVAFTDLYHTYADSWRVQPNASACSTEPATIRPGIPSKPFFASDLGRRVAARALAACRAAGITAKDLLDARTLDTTVLNDNNGREGLRHRSSAAARDKAGPGSYTRSPVDPCGVLRSRPASPLRLNFQLKTGQQQAK